MVSSEPRMELLPEEWQALADVEARSRELVGLYAPTRAEFPAWGRMMDRLASALAELDKVRGKVGGDG